MNKKESFKDLVNACRSCGEDAEAMLEIVEHDMRAFGNYVNVVYAMDASITICRARYEGQELQDKIMELDTNRRYAHEMAIAGVKRLNRFAGMLNTQPIFTGDTDDRYAVAEFCSEIVNEFFHDSTGRNFSISELLEPEAEPEYEHEDEYDWEDER